MNLSLPILTTGQDFLHSCLHFLGLHLSVLTMAILVKSDIFVVGVEGEVEEEGWDEKRNQFPKLLSDKYNQPKGVWFGYRRALLKKKLLFCLPRTQSPRGRMRPQRKYVISCPTVTTSGNSEDTAPRHSFINI